MRGLVEKFDLNSVCDYFAVDRTKRTYHGAISRNSSMQELLDYGTFLDSMQFEGLDIFWELAFKNQKFYFK